MRKTKLLILSIIVAVFFIIELYIDSELLEVTNIKVCSSKLPTSFNGYRILHLSDLHSKSFGKNNERLIQKINEISPDIVVLTGDMVSGNEVDYTVFFNFIKVVAENYKVYYIEGNHEQSLPTRYENIIRDFLVKNNVIVLDNNFITLENNGEFINLYGLCYNFKFFSKNDLKVSDITNLLGECDKSKYNIMLTHSPKFFEKYASWGADIVFSGHIHGGMVRLPFIGGIFSPDTLFFPKYDAGLYELNDSKLVVSRGLGRGATGFRLFNRPEINLITIENTEKDVD